MHAVRKPDTELTPDAMASESPPPRTISGFRARVESVPAPPSARSFRDLCLKDVVVYREGGTGDREEAEEVRVEFPYDTHFFAGLEGDLSCGGLFVATYHVLPLGTAVRLAFELPGGRRVAARGRVKWIRDHDGPTTRRGLAIAFVDAETDMLRYVAEFCSARAPFFFDFE
jgi:uncharacterized protein (TIGR02266 family)